MDNLSFILLAGGEGRRMQSAVPKQFLPLGEKPLALHSLDLLGTLPLSQIVVVCSPEYRSFFASYNVIFASPGRRRQDSVENALRLCTQEWVGIHDSARPFLTIAMIERLLKAAYETGAATTGMPFTSTVKESCEQGFVQRTLDRTRVWEIQTPQIVRRSVLTSGFVRAKKEQITVTDDVSLAELIDHPVQIVKGSARNLKITTPEDWEIAKRLYEEV